MHVSFPFARRYAVNKKESVSGSTCIGLLFWSGDSRPNVAAPGDGPLAPVRVAVGNLGDCRAVVSRAGAARALSADHKPTLEVEKNRIEAAGGWIGSKRINGVIAVSRAFGDIEYKPVEILRKTLFQIERATLVRRRPGSSFLLSCSAVS